MALLTTIPASDIIPIIVIIITKSFLAITIPKNTPDKLKTTENKIINGVEKELNWVTRINKIRKSKLGNNWIYSYDFKNFYNISKKLFKKNRNAWLGKKY